VRLSVACVAIGCTIRFVTAGETPPSPIELGDIVAGRYEVLKELGRGGMGVVFLCRDQVSSDLVALKCVILDRSPTRAKDVVWFQQEARALAALDHPAIVRARDFGVLPDGSPYLTMDAVRGRSIHVWKYLTRIPWSAIWTIVDQTLAGLAHAHARGVVHGDLKPSNIMVDARSGLEEPKAYILDLGLAWLLADRIDPRLEAHRMEAPTMPYGLGTPGWMAPEQIKNAGPHIGPPTDLYALGSIAYELLAGREVFEAKSTELLRLHRDESVPPLVVPDGVPPGVAPFVERLLAKKPWHRFRLAADARAAWAEFAPRGAIRWKAPNVRVGNEDDPVIFMQQAPPSNQEHRTLAVAPGILSVRPTPLVGREAERATIWEQAVRIAKGEPPTRRLALLRGEAGVGKSRLSEWLCEAVYEAGLMIPLRARYRRSPGPLDGMRGAVLSHYNLVGHRREDVEQALLDDWEIEADDENGRTWVAAAAAWLKPTSVDDAREIGPSGKRFFLDRPELRHVVIRHVLERIASDGRPLLIWLDDLHFASDTTFDALRILQSAESPLRFFLMCTVRDEALAAAPAAGKRIDALVADYPSTTLKLGRMGEAETLALLKATIPLSDDAQDAVYSRSNGNPLFALQLVHAWASAGRLFLRGREYAVPDEALYERAKTTAELWDERLEVVNEAERPAAMAAAALGEIIRLDVFAMLLSDMGLDAAACVSTLQRAEILYPEGGARLRWPHGLLQEHMLARLQSSPDGPRIFGLAANALSHHPDAGTRRIVRQRVSNLLRAGAPSDASELLFDYVSRAWAKVRDVSATLADLAMLEGHVSGGDHAALLRWRAEALRHSGDLTAARDLAEDARKRFERLKDGKNEAHCLRLLAHIASDQGAPALGRIEVVLARDKFASLKDAAGQAQCDVLLGEIEYLLGDHESARGHLIEAAIVFRRVRDDLGLAQCLTLHALAEQAAGQIVSSRDLLQQARAVCDNLGYQLGLAQCDVALAHVDHRAGALEAAYTLAKKTRDRFRTLGNPRGEGACERLLAMAAIDGNRLLVAKRHADACGKLYDERLADSWGRVESLVLKAQIALADGKVVEGERFLREAFSISLDEAEPIQHRYITAAWLALAVGSPAEATAALAAARAAYPDKRRSGDHTIPLLRRLAVVARGTEAEASVAAWTEFLESAPATVTPLPIDPSML
jgi:eukaryotic-like serine/threonine-protein kinase